jgi:hypothetical protein
VILVLSILTVANRIFYTWRELERVKPQERVAI